MVTFIVIGAIICSVFFISYIFKMENRTDIKEWLTCLTISYLLIGILYVLIGGMIFGATTSSMANKWEYSWENKIVAMQDSQAYIVSRRNVESSDRYYYMVEYGEGHYKQHWVSQNKSDIYEVNDDEYVVKTYTKVIEPKNWLMRDLDKFRNKIVTDEHRWEFYVPKGSVVQDFTIDLN